MVCSSVLAFAFDVYKCVQMYKSHIYFLNIFVDKVFVSVIIFSVTIADHCIHYYDLRNFKDPLMVFKGHRKAVSYSKFVNEREFVSA